MRSAPARRARLAAVRPQAREERVGDASRAALGARPPDGVAHEREPEPRDRAAAGIQRRVGMQRGPVEPRRALAAKELGGERLGRHEHEPRELERPGELDAGGQPQRPAHRRKARQHRRPQRLPVAQVRLDERLPARAVARAQRVEARDGLAERARQHGRAAARQRVGHRELRLHPAQPVALERERLEHRRGERRGVHRGEHVVLKARQRELGGLQRAAQRRRRLDDEHRAPGTRERDRRDEPVGPRPDDDRVDVRAHRRHPRTARARARGALPSQP